MKRKSVLRRAGVLWGACCLVLLACVGGVPRCALAQDTVSVTAAVEKDTVSQGEPFLLQIQVEGADLPSAGAGPDMRAVADFSVESLGSRSNSSSSITIVNGKMSKVEIHGYVYSFRLTPKKVGSITIPAIQVVVGSRTYFTQPIALKVTQPQTSEDFRLRVEYSKTRFYVGEPVVVTVTWYLGKDVESGSFNLPVFETEGLTFESPGEEQNPGRKYYQIPLGGGSVVAEQGRGSLDGRGYTTISFKKVLFAARPGVFEIPESTVSCKALVGYSRRDRRSRPFDTFFDDDFFNFGRKGVYKTFVARAEGTPLTALPLPQEGKPSDFTGAVGSFRIQASATPTDVSVGDPITLTTSVSGSPYLENIEFPTLSHNAELARDFRIPEEMAAGVVKDGAKTFTQTLRARNEAVKSIPPITFSYFDPETGRYRQAVSGAIPLQVKPNRVVTAKDIEGRTEAARPRSELEAWSQGIAHNYEGPDVLEDRRFRLSSLVRSPLWLAGLLLPLSAYLALLAAIKHRERRSVHSDAYRSRKALAVFKRRLQQAGGFSAHSEDGCEGVLLAVKEYLGDKLVIPGGALTFTDIHRLLSERGIDPELISRLGEIFAVCEQGRYGGGFSDGRSVDDLRREALGVVEKLDRKMS